MLNTSYTGSTIISFTKIGIIDQSLNYLFMYSSISIVIGNTCVNFIDDILQNKKSLWPAIEN